MYEGIKRANGFCSLSVPRVPVDRKVMLTEVCCDLSCPERFLGSVLVSLWLLCRLLLLYPGSFTGSIFVSVSRLETAKQNKLILI